MYLITVINDPANIADHDVYEVEDGVRLTDWALERYGPDGFAVPTVIYMGAINDLSEIQLTDFERMNAPINGPVWIVHSPLGVELLVAAAVAVVVAVAVAVLMPVPELGSSGPEAKKSPNNALIGQTNIARPQDRVPTIFGKVRAWPDLIAPTVQQYVGQIKVLTEYVCVGDGYYDLAAFQSGETPLLELAGSGSAVYQPGETPAQVLKTRQSNEVSGQLLTPPNVAAQETLDGANVLSYDAVTDTATITNGDWFWFEKDELMLADEMYANDGTADWNLSGSYTGPKPAGGVATFINAARANPNWLKFDGLSVPPLLVLDGDPLTPTITVADKAPERGPFIVPGNNNGEVWLDVTAPRGLARGEDLNLTLSLDMLFVFEEVDDNDAGTGVTFNYNANVTDNVVDPRFWTFKVTPADGLVAGTRYQVTGSRVTDSDPGNNLKRLEELRWARMAGIEDITAPDLTGTTRVMVTTAATEQVAARQERKFNVEATRRTVTWDGAQVVGNMVTGQGLVASRRMADAFLHYSLDPLLAALNESSIDIVQLYDVQNGLDRFFQGKKGEFSFTFDDDSTPALEEMRRIAQAARCFLYHEGSVYSVTRDQEQPVARALFNRRNKVPDSESKSIRYNRPLDNDGVELEYNDIDDNNTRTIRFPEDLPPDDPHFGMPAAINPKNIDGIGIRQYVQAWDRAQYEYRRLIYNRESVDTVVSSDGILAPLNARVQHVDGTRIATVAGDADQLGYPNAPLTLSDGEITLVDGLNIRTTGRCVFTPGLVYSVILRDERGSPSSPLVVTERPDGEKGFVLSQPAPFPLVVRGDNDYQRGTLYNFGPDGDEAAQAYLVQRKTPNPDKSVRLELINYSAEYYAADKTIPPEKPPL